MRFCGRRLAALFGAAMAAFPPTPARAGPAADVVAILSADLQPYRQALQGLQEELGGPVPLVAGAGAAEVPRQARVIVTFGSKAAMGSFPEGASVIVCMAPGLRPQDVPHRGPTYGIHMSPPAHQVVVRFKELQPKLVRLGVVWTSPAIGEYLKSAESGPAPLGIDLFADRLPDAEALPARLRSWSKRIDAVWLPPDPPLVNEATFSTLKEFAEANRIPFYAPTEGLVAKGAVAAVAGSFRDIGRTAGRTARHVLAGDRTALESYPENGLVTLNLSAAARIGLEISPDVLRRVDRVLR